MEKELTLAELIEELRELHRKISPGWPKEVEDIGEFIGLVIKFRQAFPRILTALGRGAAFGSPSRTQTYHLAVNHRTNSRNSPDDMP